MRTITFYSVSSNELIAFIMMCIANTLIFSGMVASLVIYSFSNFPGALVAALYFLVAGSYTIYLQIQSVKTIKTEHFTQEL